jgi:hypothetical protein
MFCSRMAKLFAVLAVTISFIVFPLKAAETVEQVVSLAQARCGDILPTFRSKYGALGEQMVNDFAAGIMDSIKLGIVTLNEGVIILCQILENFKTLEEHYIANYEAPPRGISVGCFFNSTTT